jgi:hypothetical protein
VLEFHNDAIITRNISNPKQHSSNAISRILTT